MENKEFKSGFVGIVGPTNSGKSTLMNALMGRKISIVSPRVQTTYHGVRGILNQKNAQVIFTDTPGYQQHPDRVARLLNRVADKNASECEVLVWTFDASNPRVMHQIYKLKTKIAQFKSKENSVCVLNKIDLVPKPSLLPMMDEIIKMDLFSEVIPISARKNNGVDHLKNIINKPLPSGPQFYPAEQVTDRSQSFLMSEFIREKIYRATRQELPYSVWIEMEEWQDPEDEGKKKKVPTYRAVIHVDSDSRKAILIGKGGEMLKRIGSEARKEIEQMLGHQVCLKLFVDVQKDWKENSRQLNAYLELE
jgi:GTP-binding protein Era